MVRGPRPKGSNHAGAAHLAISSDTAGPSGPPHRCEPGLGPAGREFGTRNSGQHIEPRRFDRLDDPTRADGQSIRLEEVDLESLFRRLTAGGGQRQVDKPTLASRYRRASYPRSRPDFSRRLEPVLKPLFSRAIRTVAWNAVRGCGCRSRAARRANGFHDAVIGRREGVARQRRRQTIIVAPTANRLRPAGSGTATVKPPACTCEVISVPEAVQI